MNQNKKIVIVLVLVLLFFGAFLSFILSSSPISSAVKKIRDCSSINEVKASYISIDNSQVKSSEVLVKEVRDKINSFNPNDAQIKECINWLPPRPVSINLVVVPDLSNRINPNLHFSDQALIDKKLFKGIWDSFKSVTGQKKKSKDRLAIDVTDNGQIDGMFRKIADKSIFSLSDNDPKLINEFYFDKAGNSFQVIIDSLYRLSSENPISGANYWKYFDQYLNERHFQKSTIYDEIHNKVILMTDGYLEFNGTENYTPIFKEPKQNPIPTCSTNYSDWSILVCEIRERPNDSGKGTYGKLKIYWHDWLERMKFGNVEEDFFVESNPATGITIEKIRQFIGAISVSEKAIANATPSVSAKSNKQTPQCLTEINSLINGSQQITDENIDDLVKTATINCGVSKIVIDDGTLRRNLKRFLLLKSKEPYEGLDATTQGNTLTIKAQKL